MTVCNFYEGYERVLKLFEATPEDSSTKRLLWTPSFPLGIVLQVSRWAIKVACHLNLKARFKFLQLWLAHDTWSQRNGKMELSFLAGLCLTAVELPSFSHHLVWRFFLVLCFNKGRNTDGISPRSCALCAVVISQHPCLIPASYEQEEKIKDAYCRLNIRHVAGAVPDFYPDLRAALFWAMGGEQKEWEVESHIHVLGISQGLLVCLFNEVWAALFATGGNALLSCSCA